ncbi:MAG: hypothetical protein DHS20C14_15240 [Phycisphaeraceae bacterium]|nr:MAG: hypothetical protein DHS20C14_15240 [Phycisphaeraceae bacterium]
MSPDPGGNLEESLGRVTISTPMFIPVDTDDERRLRLISGDEPLYTEESIKEDLHKANVGLSSAEVKQLALALSVAFAGPSLDLSSAQRSVLNPDGTVTTSGESSRSLTQQTPAVPGAATPPTPNAKAMEALVGLLTDPDTANALPVANTMTLISSLKAYAASLEDYYNAAYFQDLVADNYLDYLKLRRETGQVRREFGEGALYPAQTRVTELSTEIDQLYTEASQKEIRFSVPYRATFRVSAAPGWFTQLHQLDAMIDLKFQPKAGQSGHTTVRGVRVLGAIPAETTQTLDEFEATLRQFTLALQGGGQYGVASANASLQKLEASAQRLEGLRTNNTFLAEFPNEATGNSNRLRLRFSPEVVPNASRRMMDRGGLNVTALVMVDITATFDKPKLDGKAAAVIASLDQALDQLNQTQSIGDLIEIETSSSVQRGIVLNQEGEYEAPSISLEGISSPIAGKLTPHVAPFARDVRVAPLGFSKASTSAYTWITPASNAQQGVPATPMQAEAIILTRLTDINPNSEIELSVVDGPYEVKSMNGKTGTPSAAGGLTKCNVYPGNDVIIHLKLDPSTIIATTSKDKKTTTHSVRTFPVMLQATVAGESVTTWVTISNSPTSPPTKSAASDPASKKKEPAKPVLNFTHNGITLNIPADQLTPELAAVLQAAFTDTQIIVPGMTVQKAPDTSGGGTGTKKPETGSP